MYVKINIYILCNMYPQRFFLFSGWGELKSIVSPENAHFRSCFWADVNPPPFSIEKTPPISTPALSCVRSFFVKCVSF